MVIVLVSVKASVIVAVSVTVAVTVLVLVSALVLVSVWVLVSVVVTVLVATKATSRIFAGLARVGPVTAHGSNVDHTLEGIIDFGSQIDSIVAHAEDSVGGRVWDMGAAIDLDGVGTVNGVDVDVVGVAWVAALHAPDVAEEGEGSAERCHSGGGKFWGGELDSSGEENSIES